MSTMAAMLLARIADPSADALAELGARLAPALASPDHPVCSLPSLVQALDKPLAYLYLPADHGRPDWLEALLPQAQWTVLTTTLVLTGASAHAAAPFHYVVEADVLPESEAELNAWYIGEHLPGLAAVPGTVRAARSLAAAGPRHFASYELASLETFESPPWLAVRATEWSSRVRPSFRNIHRTMFRRVPLG